MNVGVVILTLNAETDVRRLLPIVCAEVGVDSILVVDSASIDQTREVVSEHEGVDLIVLERSEFNHGATREFARKKIGTDIVVFLTQDVIPVPGFIGALVSPIKNKEAVVAYSRQLPHDGAGVLEAFPRLYNYASESYRRTLDDTKTYGVMTFFCSDSCSAYLNSALDRVGGMHPILTNEDYFAVAKLLKDGFAISYAANSQVKHSHSYTIVAEFQRYFDTGFVRGQRTWVNKLVGNAENHGVGFVKALFSFLIRNKPLLIPYALIQVSAKWFGYRLGYYSTNMPPGFCKFFSSQKYFWSSRHFTDSQVTAVDR